MSEDRGEKRRKYKDVQRDQEGFPTALPMDAGYRNCRITLPKTNLHVAIKAGVYDPLSRPTPDWDRKSLVRQFKTLVAKNRGRAIRLQSAGYPAMRDPVQLQRARNCVPYGFGVRPLVQLRCSKPMRCPFCYAHRLRLAWAKFENVFSRRRRNNRFHIFSAVGTRTVGEIVHYMDDPDLWGRLQSAVFRDCRSYGRPLQAMAGWWQHVHFHPTGLRDTTFDCTWQVLVVGSAQQIADMRAPTGSFLWESKCEDFDLGDAERPTEQLAERFGEVLAFRPQILTGNIDVAARLHTLSDESSKWRFMAGGVSSKPVGNRRSRESHPYGVPRPWVVQQPTLVPGSASIPAEPGPTTSSAPEAVVVLPEPPPPAPAEPILIEPYMNHPVFRAIHEWLTELEIKSTPAQRRALFYKFVEAKLFNPKLDLPGFLKILQESFHVPGLAPDLWFPEALVQKNCPLTEATARKHGVLVWSDVELVDTFLAIDDVTVVLREQNEPPRPLPTLFAHAVKLRNQARLTGNNDAAPPFDSRQPPQAEIGK